MRERIVMSSLPKTWILDLDGTLVKHNGYKIDGVDTLLSGAKIILEQIKEKDMVIIVSSRELKYKEQTEEFLKEMGITYDYLIFDAPYGERIVINDNKPSGLKMAWGLNCDRDEAIVCDIFCDESL